MAGGRHEAKKRVAKLQNGKVTHLIQNQFFDNIGYFMVFLFSNSFLSSWYDLLFSLLTARKGSFAVGWTVCPGPATIKSLLSPLPSLYFLHWTTSTVKNTLTITTGISYCNTFDDFAARSVHHSRCQILCHML